MSVNHQFIQYSDNVIKRYVKPETVPYIICGIRLDPSNPNKQIDFLLKTPEKNFNFETKKVNGFSYDDDVLELYSDVEVRLFERLNRHLIEQGLLKEYKGNADQVNTSNLLNDEEVDEIAGIRQLVALKAKINTITSIPSLQRIKNAAEALSRPLSIMKAIDERINELNNE